MGVEPAESIVSTDFVHAAAVCVFVCVCVYEPWLWGSTWERAGVPGHQAFNSKTFQGLSVTRANDFSRRSLDFGFSPPLTPTAIKHCMFGMQNMEAVDENSNTHHTQARKHCGLHSTTLKATFI